MIYVRLVNANEIGIRKAGKSKRAGSFLMVSKKCLDFLPELNAKVPDDTIRVQYISPNDQNINLVEYVWHNKALHEERSTRNEYRLYFSRDLDAQNYIEPQDIVVMKRVKESSFDGLKLFLFKKEKDKEYDLITEIIGSKTHSLHEKLNIDYIDNYTFCSEQLDSSVAIDSKRESVVHMHENKDEDPDIINPSAASMIENLRSFGYSPEEAIADIVDNSISAEATNIHVDIQWHGTNSYISIMDDGIGMTESELIQAMRPGSKNPNADRSSSDLGRFGMGLKSASFSIGKDLTVTSLKNKEQSTRRWDLEYVAEHNKWKVLKTAKENSMFNSELISESGTIVLIESLDRLLSLNGSKTIINNEDFFRIAEKISFHLSLVFHRYLEKENIAIFVNGKKIKAFDPHFSFSGTPLFHSEGENVEIESFIVDREENLSVPTQRTIKRTTGFTQMQGIYIYREDRLISYGGWLNLGRRQQMKINDDYALGRVIVNLKNSEDKNWRIDIKKSTAHPPLNELPNLNRAAEIARKTSSQNINKVIGRDKKKENFEGLWSKSEKGIKIDRGNSLYRQLASDDDVGEKFMEYIKDLEKKLPL
ncbi:ATP-binding protein [Halobacteriovorax sp. HFRX-2_2]|uniref:ATP-binding protein n=1 Tax=unclassified Halobacteriovorax TaxID=2639665 RepID=UPI00371FE8EB